MGREIKFRAKRKDDVWVYGSLVVGTNGETMYIFTSEGAQWSVFSETVGQYTGLMDKNFRDIYEGDATKDEFDRVAIITWKENEARFAMRYVGKKTEYRMFINHLQMEIIGNIYENPELIEV